MKCARDQMDIVNAYAALGTYRGAAALCGTTHKTVKRVLERRARGEAGRRRVRRIVAESAACGHERQGGLEAVAAGVSAVGADAG